jgi:CubicO group peptidase (beta-lactamase class C family)
VETGSRVAQQLTAAQRPPGLSMAVLDGDRPTWSDGFGLADVETRRQAAPDTVYLWRSGIRATSQALPDTSSATRSCG